jgi:hypothetical protein
MRSDNVTLPLADAQMLLAWMDETFGNEDGTDWHDEDAGAVAEALNKAIENFRAMRAACGVTTCTRSHPHENMNRTCERLTVIAREQNAAASGVMPSPTGRRRLCRDCADFAQDGICPNDGKPCSSAGVLEGRGESNGGKTPT